MQLRANSAANDTLHIDEPAEKKHLNNYIKATETISMKNCMQMCILSQLKYTQKLFIFFIFPYVEPISCKCLHNSTDIKVIHEQLHVLVAIFALNDTNQG